MSWESRFLNNQPPNVNWHFKTDDEQWRQDAKEMCEDNKFYKDEENHFYKNENCPSGACIFGSASKPIFNNAESVDSQNPNVAWTFYFGDREFRRRALTAPSCVHMKEIEFHEFHKKEGEYEERNLPKPQPILKSIDCAITDPCETCKPPCHLVPPCVPCVPPPPPPSCCVPYPNTMGEKEWHTIRKCTASQADATQENESCLYKRDVKSCDPCALPQIWNGRMYSLPAATMRPGEMDKHSVDSPPGMETLPPKYNYNEDEGECNKRETRGPGVYPYPGFVPSAPLSQPGNVPCGYHFNEEQSHVYCTTFGCPPVQPEIKHYPPFPECKPTTGECKPGNNPFIEPTCGTGGPCGTMPSQVGGNWPCGPYGPCGPCYPTSLRPLGPCGPCGPCGPVGGCGPCGPVGGCGPCGPVGGCGPCGPVGGCGPCGPVGGCGPCGPVGGCGPCGPVGGCGPCGPVGGCGPCSPYGFCGPCSPYRGCGPCGPWLPGAPCPPCRS